MSLNLPFEHFADLYLKGKKDEFLSSEFLLKVNGFPVDLYKLAEGEHLPLLGFVSYSFYPSRLTISFLAYMVSRGIIEVDLKENEYQIILKRKLEFINLTDIKKVEKWIKKSQQLYNRISERAKIEYYQDFKREYLDSFHRLYLKELFLNELFPYAEGFNYLVIGDDEAKGLFLSNLIKEGHNISLTIADIDPEIISMYEEIFEKEKLKNKIDLKVIDTRFTRDCVDKQYDVVISYSLTNTSFNTLVDFLRGKVKDYGIAYISNYPALIDNYDAYLGLHKYLYDRGFWVTHTTPFFLRVTKIPELIYL